MQPLPKIVQNPNTVCNFTKFGHLHLAHEVCTKIGCRAIKNGTYYDECIVLLSNMWMNSIQLIVWTPNMDEKLSKKAVRIICHCHETGSMLVLLILCSLI